MTESSDVLILIKLYGPSDYFCSTLLSINPTKLNKTGILHFCVPPLGRISDLKQYRNLTFICCVCSCKFEFWIWHATCFEFDSSVLFRLLFLRHHTQWIRAYI